MSQVGQTCAKKAKNLRRTAVSSGWQSHPRNEEQNWPMLGIFLKKCLPRREQGTVDLIKNY